jgi:hypothetical protein
MNLNQSNPVTLEDRCNQLTQTKQMHTCRKNLTAWRWCFPAILLALLGMAVSAAAQNYSVDWFSVDGGGGTSTGGVYGVSGTIGQADAGNLAGGNYIATGGFWSLIRQDQLRRTIKLKRQSGNLVLSWPADASEVVVQSATSLAPTADWSKFEGTPIRVGDEFELIVGPANTPPSPIRFFRLYLP